MVNFYEELGSYRAVAAVVGYDHKTVKAWLERTRQGVAVAGVVRRRATDPFLHLIRDRVEMTEGRLWGKRLLSCCAGPVTPPPYGRCSGRCESRSDAGRSASARSTGSGSRRQVIS